MAQYTVGHSQTASELANVTNACGCLTESCIEILMKTKLQGCKAEGVGWVLKQCDRETVRRRSRGQGHSWLHNYLVPEN